MVGVVGRPEQGWVWGTRDCRARMKRSRMHAFLWVIGAGTLSVLGLMLSANDLPASVTYSFGIAWVAPIGWLFCAAVRCSTGGHQGG